MSAKDNMEQSEAGDTTAIDPAGSGQPLVGDPSAKVAKGTRISAASLGHVQPAQAPAPACPTCGAADVGSLARASYVYTHGVISWRFPTIDVEKQVAQVTGRAETAGRTDQQAFHDILSQRENRYLARHLCWILTVQGIETYILQPRDPADIDLLISAV